MDKSKKKRFIPEQVRKTEVLLNHLCAMQYQMDKINLYKKELAEFDRCPLGISHYQTAEHREGIQNKHDKHVTIYNNILDHYQTVLCAMSANVIMHMCGAHPLLPTENIQLVPSFHQLKATA